ncbi:MAG: SLC13 family permease [Pseudomonadota bacterium]
MEPSIAAMTGAAILMVVRHVNIVDILEHEIEWSTLIFFMMLFIIVAGAEETGLIQLIADWVNHLSRESLVVAILVTLWVSALASAIIDNIPFTATMLPVVAYLNEVIPGRRGRDPLVGPGPRGVPRGERDDDRRQCQYGYCGYSRKAREVN